MGGTRCFLRRCCLAFPLRLLENHTCKVPRRGQRKPGENSSCARQARPILLQERVSTPTDDSRGQRTRYVRTLHRQARSHADAGANQRF